jgi:uncharacterized protein (TIGR02231 family)
MTHSTSVQAGLSRANQSRKWYLLSLLLIGALTAFGSNDTIHVNSTIYEVRVYDQGADIKCKATVDLPKGISDVVLENCARSYDGIILRVRVNKPVTTMTRRYEDHPAGAKIHVEVNSDQDQSVEILCEYHIRESSWKPIYEIEQGPSEAAIQVRYKADIINNSGVGWEHVKMYLIHVENTRQGAVPTLKPDGYILNPLISGGYGNDIITLNTRMYYFVDSIKTNRIPSDLLLKIENSALLNDGDMMTIIELTEPLNIPKSGGKKLVTVLERVLNYAPHFQCIPKTNDGVFALARITGHHGHLLPGYAYWSGQRDKILIEPELDSFSDTTLVFLGKDSQISVSRIEKPVLTELFGSERIEIHTVEIHLESRKSELVEVELFDQIPVTNPHDIEVKLLKKDNAELQDKSGQLRWKLKLKPKGHKEVQFEYKLTYPRDRTVVH